MITQERLKELLHYDPKTGLFMRIEPLGFPTKDGYAGSVDHGYRRIIVDGKRYLAHRLAWLYVYGEHPKGDIDHINRTGLDNRIVNLRVVSANQNKWNAGAYAGNKFGMKGVSKKGNRFRAQICDGHGYPIHLGTYDTPEEAHEAYLKKAKELRGDFGYGV